MGRDGGEGVKSKQGGGEEGEESWKRGRYCGMEYMNRAYKNRMFDKSTFNEAHIQVRGRSPEKQLITANLSPARSESQIVSKSF